MRVVQVVGSKGSGKTTLCAALVEEGSRFFDRIAYVKSTHLDVFDVRGRDTATVGADVRIGVGRSETVVFADRRDVEDVLAILALLGFDLVVVEGFASRELSVRLSTDGEHDPDDALVAVTPGEDPAELVERYALKYTGDADCGRCGYGTCAGFRRAVARGEARPDDCEAEETPTILVDERPLTLGSFVAALVEEVVKALVRSLKGGEGDEILLRVRR